MCEHANKTVGSKAIVILGTQWGDEGKGKIVDLLSQSAHVVCRCQGGNNAGHTVVVNGVMYDFHLLPSGLLNPDCLNVIGNGVVIHLPGLFDEIEKNESKGLTNWHDRLFVSSRAHLVFDFHQAADSMEESGKGQNQIGTTKKGIGPAYSCKAARSGIRVCDLIHDFCLFSERFKWLANLYMQRYPTLKVDIDSELKRYKEFRDRLAPLVRDTITFLSNEFRQPNRRIIVEGANATMLDIDFGTYPMVTSSNCSVGGVYTGLGIPPHVVGKIYGVAKAYCTRVGRGVFPTEMDKKTDEIVRKRGNEYGVTTQRARRCGWFDAFQLSYVDKINGFSALAVTKLDILDEFDEVKIGVEYLIGGKIIDYYPASQEELQTVCVKYITLPGWKSPTSNVRSFDGLPLNARNYIEKLEELVNIPIKWIGVGSSRDATICRCVQDKH
ncbi:hypothetical protein HELRODRAFT_93565 [Helobdella robusta]|uniref:Adenylosuccinate synthetase n=1 Tax=Helobdella robusta TaxID=6412 RepID=T1G8W6_HELRO|nr:hypothetical protein HELRODRAFT_93565 [Helobdella robusta]ESO12930.1 hypothetical protein HELRODRAFT_93565 [Helobdella robusta]